MKSNKSYLKRLRITTNGKIVARKKGHGHFNAKGRNQSQIKKKRSVILSFPTIMWARFLPRLKVKK